MTVKSYLKYPSVLDMRISQKLQEREDLRAALSGLAGTDFSHIRVRKSGRCDAAFVCSIEKITELEREIDEQIDQYITVKHRIIEQIQSMEDRRYVEILFKHYIEQKRLEDVAEEMYLSYGHVLNLHGFALRAFEQKFKNLMEI